MLTEQERAQAADILMEAERTKKPAVQLSKTFPHIEIEDSIRSRARRRGARSPAAAS